MTQKKKKIDRRCKELDESGNCFCHRYNKYIEGLAVSFCVSGYRKSAEIPFMKCHTSVGFGDPII